MTRASASRVVTIVLAEDQEIVRRGLCLLLSRVEGIRVIGEAEDGKAAVRVVSQLQPDVVLMDAAMPELDGLEAAKIIKQKMPGVKIIVLTGYDDAVIILKMLESGVDGYLPKVVSTEELVRAIHIVSQGGTYFSAVVRKVTGDVPPEAFRSRKAGQQSPLTQREKEILQLIAEGKTHQEIANLLHLSVRTVDTHRNNILKKLDIHNAAGLVLYAVRNGLVRIR
jgi:DNA-binding NarL/FixJ family response regulator